jgi:hypothetical protein
MANILAVLGGPSYEALCAMYPADLMRWHDRALDRASKE